VREAVRSLLEDVSYRQHAGQMQAEISELPPTEKAAEWIEALAANSRPIS
jgi:UDP:flavonoid glycosyltransferase YjiC (YdhE family)